MRVDRIPLFAHRWLRLVFGAWALTLALGHPAATQAAVVTLYDGGLGGLPATQGLIYQGLGPTQVAAAGATTLDSSGSKAFQGGYTPQVGLLPALDRSRGFNLRFSVQLTAEDHAGSDRNSDLIDDRAGFSVIVLGADKRGIELGFWTGRVWAQAGGGVGDGPIFTQAEGTALDTRVERSYDLTIHGDSYELRTGGILVLSGALRDYSSFGSVYTTPSFIFLGDNTTSASATTRIRVVSAQLLDYQIVLPLVVKG